MSRINALLRSRTGLTFLVLLVTLGLGITIGTVLVDEGVFSAERADIHKLKVQGTGSPLVLDQEARLVEGFTQVAETVEPTVVNVSTTSIVHRQRRQRSTPDPLRDFFGEDFMERFGGPSEQKRDSLGSGVIVDSEGYILSNYHVVAPVGQGNRRQLADKITVTLHTGEAFKGTVVGVDPESDLAVLKIDTPKALPFAKVGDSSNIRTGQWVLAIGNPFGVGKTVTSGIISATARVVKEMPIFGDYIQTDAAINPGNSGGPLVNMKGEVIGINSFIFSRTGGSQGVGFAIPSSVFVNSYNQLVETGKIERGWLGVSMNTFPMTDEMAEFFGVEGSDPKGIKDGDGVIVTGLVDESAKVGESGPAYKAGVRPEDVIVKVGDVEVETAWDLRSTIANTPPGKQLPMVVVRKGEVLRLNVTLADRTIEQQERSESEGLSFEERKKEERPKQIGLEFRTLSARDADQLGLEGENGVIITEVSPGSKADEAGLRPNLVVTHVNGQPVGTAQQFYDRINSMSTGEGIILRVLSVTQRSASTVSYVSFRKP